MTQLTHLSMNVSGGADVLSSLRPGHALNNEAGGDHPVREVTDDNLDVLATSDHLRPGVVDPVPGDSGDRGTGHPTL